MFLKYANKEGLKLKSLKNPYKSRTNRQATQYRSEWRV